jgi:hypothetical protein
MRAKEIAALMSFISVLMSLLQQFDENLCRRTVNGRLERRARVRTRPAARHSLQ